MPNKIRLAHLPTPIRKLTRLSAHFSEKNLWLKSDDMSGFALGGNKVRKLEFLLADAITHGATTVITCGGVQSNHCRATAFACAQLGLNCHLLLRNDRAVKNQSSANQANHLLDQLSGASIELHEPRAYGQDLDSLFELAAERVSQGGGTAYCIPVGGSNGLGVWGYVNAVTELKEQCEELGFVPDLIICASGSGGTQAGLTLGVEALNLPSKVLGFAVCDSEAYFKQKIETDILACLELTPLHEKDIAQLMSRIEIATNDQYIGPGYAKADKDVYETIKLLAATEGVLLDPVYTGKAMHGLLSELARGSLDSARNILFIHTGGAFGVFPHAEGLLDSDG